MRAWMVAGLMSVSSIASATPGAIVVPPGEVEIGAGAPIGDPTLGTSTEFRAGMHWASLYWHPTRFDIGFGFVASTRQSLSLTVDRAIAPEDHVLSLKGAYMSAAYAIESHRHWRTWLGARLEMLAGDHDGHSVTTTGVAVRLATEVFAAGIGGASDNRTAALFAGAFAVGIYVEGIHRGIPGDLGEIDAAAGLTMRIPFIAAIGS